MLYYLLIFRSKKETESLNSFARKSGTVSTKQSVNSRILTAELVDSDRLDSQRWRVSQSWRRQKWRLLSPQSLFNSPRATRTLKCRHMARNQLLVPICTVRKTSLFRRRASCTSRQEFTWNCHSDTTEELLLVRDSLPSTSLMSEPESSIATTEEKSRFFCSTSMTQILRYVC